MSKAFPFTGSAIRIANCKSDWTLHGEKCYFLVDQSHSWTDSLKHCQSLNSTLASIHDEPTNTFLVNFAQFGLKFWSGGYKVGDDFYWIDQSPFGPYTNWRDGQPDNANANEDKIEVFRDAFDRQWNDAPDDARNVAICQYDAL